MSETGDDRTLVCFRTAGYLTVLPLRVSVGELVPFFSTVYDVCCLNGALIKGYQHEPQPLKGNHLLGILISVCASLPVTNVWGRVRLSKRSR